MPEIRPPMYGCEFVFSDGKECDKFFSTLPDRHRSEDGFFCPDHEEIMAEPDIFELIDIRGFI